VLKKFGVKKFKNCVLKNAKNCVKKFRLEKTQKICLKKFVLETNAHKIGAISQ